MGRVNVQWEERPMSVLDQLRSLEQQVLERLRELRPLVAEYRDLEQVAERLGLKREADEPSGAGVPQARKSEPATEPRARRAAGRPKQAAARKPTAAAATKPKPKSSAATAPAASNAKPKPAAATAPAASKPKPK